MSETTAKDRVRELTDKLETGLKELFEGDNYKQYLNAMSKFHKYSFKNTMLILKQKPDATLLAGFKVWQRDFERSVKKGEHGISIFAPTPKKIIEEQQKKDKDTGNLLYDADGKPIMEKVVHTIPYFKSVTVFDVSQTDGKPLPQIAVELTGKVADYETLFEALKEISPVPIEIERIDSDTKKGYFSRAEKRIVIKAGMSEVQNVKTAVHEIAHAMLHDKDIRTLDGDVPDDKNTKEVQAESIAYVVCQHFGIDTSDYSFGYLASWGSGIEMPELKASLEIINKAASELIEKISGKLPEREISAEISADAPSPETQRETQRRSDIIGNTEYREINPRAFIKVPTTDIEDIMQKLDSADIRYSGKLGKSETTLTVYKSERDKVQGLLGIEEKISEKSRETRTVPKRESRTVPVSAAEQERRRKILDEEKQSANYVNLPHFLMENGFELKRVGKEYTLRDHDSVRIYDNSAGETGKWYRFSTGKGGDNISFVQEFLGKSFKEAVEMLNGGRSVTANMDIPEYKPHETPKREVKEIHIEENTDAKRAIAYLSQTRGLDYNLVTELVKEGKIAQEAKTGNVVFYAKDENGMIVGAEKVGTSTENRFKGIEAGSSSDYGFEIVKGTGENAFFFESAIDALSFAQIHKDEMENCRLISMTGVKSVTVEAFMNRKNIPPEKIFLCSDNDEKGNYFAKKLMEKYPNMKRVTTSDNFKDWNDQLRGIEISALADKIEKPSFVIIGNTPYKEIENRFFAKMSAEKAEKIAAELEKNGVKFSGKVIDRQATLTLNKADASLYKKISSEIDSPLANNVQAEQQKAPISEAPEKTAESLFRKKDRFSDHESHRLAGIFQLKDIPETRDLRFEPFERLTKEGITPNVKDYSLVDVIPVDEGRETHLLLDDIFTLYNTAKPQDFKGHSLSVSDVIVINDNGSTTAYYVDRAGFKELPDFVAEANPSKIKSSVEKSEVLNDEKPFLLQQLSKAAMTVKKNSLEYSESTKTVQKGRLVNEQSFR